MADYDSSLPVRSEADGTDERVLVKVQDGADPGGANSTMTVTENKAHVRAHGSDSDGNDVELLLSQEGHQLTNGDYDATNNKRPSSQGLIVSDRDASPSETTMNSRPTAVAGDDDKVAMDVAISDSSGNRIDQDNPLAVYVSENPGTEIEDYNESVDVASSASANVDYTVTASTEFRGLNLWGSASSKAKFELQIETGVGAGTYNTVAVRFNSTANPNIEYIPKYPVTIAAGIIIRIVVTNLDNQAQSIYTTLNGVERAV